MDQHRRQIRDQQHAEMKAHTTIIRDTANALLQSTVKRHSLQTKNQKIPRGKKSVRTVSVKAKELKRVAKISADDFRQASRRTSLKEDVRKRKQRAERRRLSGPKIPSFPSPKNLALLSVHEDLGRGSSPPVDVERVPDVLMGSLPKRKPIPFYDASHAPKVVPMGHHVFVTPLPQKEGHLGYNDMPRLPTQMGALDYHAKINGLLDSVKAAEMDLVAIQKNAEAEHLKAQGPRRSILEMQPHLYGI